MTRITPPAPSATEPAPGVTLDGTTWGLQYGNEAGYPHAAGTHTLDWNGGGQGGLQSVGGNTTQLRVQDSGLFVFAARIQINPEHHTATHALFQLDAASPRDIMGVLSQEVVVPVVTDLDDPSFTEHTLVTPPFFVDYANDVDPTTFFVVAGCFNDTWKVGSAKVGLVKLAY